MSEQLSGANGETSHDTERAIVMGKALLERTVVMSPGLKPESDADKAIKAGVALIEQNVTVRSGLKPEKTEDS